MGLVGRAAYNFILRWSYTHSRTPDLDWGHSRAAGCRRSCRASERSYSRTPPSGPWYGGRVGPGRAAMAACRGKLAPGGASSSPPRRGLGRSESNRWSRARPVLRSRTRRRLREQGRIGDGALAAACARTAAAPAPGPRRHHVSRDPCVPFSARARTARSASVKPSRSAPRVMNAGKTVRAAMAYVTIAPRAWGSTCQ